MTDMWLSLNDIPAEGREFSFSDAAIWNDPKRELGLDCGIGPDFEGKLTILPQKNGILINGRLKGSLEFPCDRCAERVSQDVDHDFSLFESFEKEPGDEIEVSYLRPQGKSWDLNVSGLLWEQFILAQPIKPLCVPDCLGICAHCGQNLNVKGCTCVREELDPRLSVLKNIKIS